MLKRIAFTVIVALFSLPAVALDISDYDLVDLSRKRRQVLGTCLRFRPRRTI